MALVIPVGSDRQLPEHILLIQRCRQRDDHLCIPQVGHSIQFSPVGFTQGVYNGFDSRPDRAFMRQEVMYAAALHLQLRQ